MKTHKDHGRRKKNKTPPPQTKQKTVKQQKTKYLKKNKNVRTCIPVTEFPIGTLYPVIMVCCSKSWLYYISKEVMIMIFKFYLIIFLAWEREVEYFCSVPDWAVQVDSMDVSIELFSFPSCWLPKHKLKTEENINIQCSIDIQQVNF